MIPTILGNLPTIRSVTQAYKNSKPANQPIAPVQPKPIQVAQQPAQPVQQGFIGPMNNPNPTQVKVGQPVVAADSLMQPQQPIVLPPPIVPTMPGDFVSRLAPAAQQSTNGLVKAETKEATQRDDVLNRLLNQGTPDSQGIFDNAFKGAGGEKYLQQFTDANTTLAMLQGKFNTAKQGVSSSKGQSQVQEGFSLNELGRQEAVQVGNQALVVQAMQGNLNTARQIALDTTKFANEDRQAELSNLIAQFNALDGIVSGQEQQLIDQNKEAAELEKAELTRTQNAIDTAITGGGATVEEMQQLTSLDLSNAQKQSIAQQIIARTANEDRAFKNELDMLNFSLDEQEVLSNLTADTQNRDTSVTEINGRKVLVDNQTGEIISDFSEYTPEQTQAAIKEAQGLEQKLLELYNDSGLNKAVGPRSSQIPGALKSGEANNFISRFNNIVTLLAKNDLSMLKGAMSDKDIEFLKQGASAMSLNMTEDAFRSELKKVIERVQEKIQNPDGGSGAPTGTPPAGEMWVKEKSTGQWGSIPVNEFDPNTYDTGSFKQAGNASASKTLTSALVQKFPPGTRGGQCGDFVRRLATTQGLTYPRLGNSLTEKVNAVRKNGEPMTNARVGSVIVTKENPTYGHVAYIVGKNDKGYVVAESNFKQNEKVSYGRVIPYGSPNLIGIINPTRT